MIAAIILKVNLLLFVHNFSSTCVPKLAGASEEEIASDYALSRVGREPLRERSLLRLSMEPLFASNQEAALNMFSCRWVFGWLLVHYIRLIPIKLDLRRYPHSSKCSKSNMEVLWNILSNTQDSQTTTSLP